MSEYLHAEKPFSDQIAALGWKVIDQGEGFIPTDPAKNLRTSFREWFFSDVFSHVRGYTGRMGREASRS